MMTVVLTALRWLSGPRSVYAPGEGPSPGVGAAALRGGDRQGWAAGSPQSASPGGSFHGRGMNQGAKMTNSTI